MYLLFGIFFFVLGTLVGSFLNVIALRYNTGLSISRGRSQCFSCGGTLHWYELIPVVSFLIQRGKCRQCGAKFSVQYPLVELLTGALFLGVFLKLVPPSIVSFSSINLTELVYYFCVFSILVVILIYDVRHKIIPDGLVYTFIAFSFLHLLLITPTGHLLSPPYLYDFLAGPIFFFFFFLLWYFSRGNWMGFGDAKLVLGIGLFLGLAYGISALIFAFWIGAIVGLLLVLLPRLVNLLPASSKGLFPIRALSGSFRGLTMKSELPFAPFLILGLWIVFFFPVDIAHVGVFLTLVSIP